MAIKNSASRTALLIEIKKSEDFGRELLKKFHEENRKFSNYKISFDQLISILTSRPTQKNFLSILGGAVINSSSSKSKALLAMENLARATKGRIPAKNADFRAAIIEGATQFQLVDAVIFTATESAKEIVEGAQQFGDQLILTGKILNLFLPVIILYLVYSWVQKKAA